MFKSLLCVLFLAAALPTQAQVQTGLDPSFGNFNGNGYVKSTGNSLAEINRFIDVAIQPSEKILATGGGGVICYNTDGSIDNTFGNNGIIEPSIGYVIKMYTNGRFLIVSSNPFGEIENSKITRFHPDGAIDNTFGENGVLDSMSPSPEVVAIQSDEKILTAGVYEEPIIDYPYHAYIVIKRYNANGSVDSSFGISGSDTALLPDSTVGSNNRITIAGMYVTEDNKIVIGGHYDDYMGINARGWYSARFHSNGTLDTSYNHTGCAHTGGLDFVKAMILQPDGKVLLAGNQLFDEAEPIIVLRYNIDGNLDTGFDTTGMADVYWKGTPGTPGRVNDIALQQDGGIIIAGESWDNSTEWTPGNFALVRCLPNGLQDMNFGMNGGISQSITNENEECRAIAIQTDNKIIAAGGNYSNTGNVNGPSVIARYLKDAHSTGIDDTDMMQEKIEIYPNPTHDFIFIQNNTSYKLDEIKLYDITGRLFLRTRENNINTISLPSGCYFLSIRINTIKKIFYKSIIVNH